MRNEGRGLSAAGWVAVALVVLWLAAWIYQLSVGLQVTGLGQQVVWGLYIAGFFTAAGAGAGLVAVAVVGGAMGFATALTRVKLLVLALASFIAAGVLITMDVGSPLTMWRLVVGFQFESMMTWDFWLLALTFILTLVLVYQKPAAGTSGLGWVTLAAGVVLVAAEGWMLSSLAARPLWSGGQSVVSFLVGAAIGGQALALLVIPSEADGKLKLGLKAMMWLNLVLVAAEVLSGLIGGSPRGTQEMLGVLTSTGLWLHVIVGLIVPLVLLGRSVKTAAGLAVLGVLLEKLWYLSAGQQKPWFGELPLGSYLPSFIEAVAIIGVVALGALIYRGWSKSVLRAS
jgi:molybdopterin-containing oxidoreductase family membrane subunit